MGGEVQFFRVSFESPVPEVAVCDLVCTELDAGILRVPEISCPWCMTPYDPPEVLLLQDYRETRPPPQASLSLSLTEAFVTSRVNVMEVAH